MFSASRRILQGLSEVSSSQSKMLDFPFIRSLLHLKSFQSATIFLVIHSILDPVISREMLGKIRCKKNEYGYTECTCPDDPITERYPDMTDPTCEYYYLCHLSRAMKVKCGYNAAFHPKLKECYPRQRVPESLCKPLVSCNAKPNRYVEDKNDCTKYFLCYVGTYSHWTCQEDFYFDPVSEKCVSDKEQAEACVMMAKRNHFKNIGYEEPPPKTSIALDQSKAFFRSRFAKNNTNTNRG